MPAKLLQSFPTLCNPKECSPPGFFVHEISQAGILENESESHSVVSDSLQPHGLYSPWNSLDQNTGVGNFSFLQGSFPTQGLNPGLPHCRWILYQLSHKGSPWLVGWEKYEIEELFDGIESGRDLKRRRASFTLMHNGRRRFR